MGTVRTVTPQTKTLADTSVDFDKTGFFGQIVRQLATSLQNIVGLAEAEAFVALVASELGDDINKRYCDSLAVPKLPDHLISAVLVDLKRRIGGSFKVEFEDNDVIVLRNSSCPFGSQVVGRPALCMMTTNVFGRITANTTGYAYVNIDKAIANGDNHCRVVVHLRPPQESPSDGKEFFGQPAG